MSGEISRFESSATGLNLDQYHVFRSVVDTHHRGEVGLFFYMVAVAQKKLIYGIP